MMNIVENLYPIFKSVQGESHIRAENEELNKNRGRKFPCQDYSFSGYISPTVNSSFSTPFYFSSVCDGLGSAPHFRSGKGAELGTKALLFSVEKYVDSISNFDNNILIKSELKKIVESTYKTWLESVSNELKKNPITDLEWTYLREETEFLKYYNRYKNGEDLEDIYGCTALAFVYIPSKKIWFALQIGDGDIVIRKKDEVAFTRIVPMDGEKIGPETDSICDKNAINRFRIDCGINEEVDYAFCSSDGVSESFNVDKGFFNFYNEMIREYCLTDKGDELNTNIEKRIQETTNEFAEYLSKLSKERKQDDMSVSGFLKIDSEIIKNRKNAQQYINKGKELIDSDIETALKYFQFASRYEVPEAFMYEGKCWAKKFNKEKAIEFFEKAISSGCVGVKKELGSLQCEKGIQLKNCGKYLESFEEFKKASENESAEAQYWLSMMYAKPQEFENCIKQNTQLFFDYLKLSAKNNFPEAQYKLAMCYKYGNFVSKNPERAEEYFNKSIEGSCEDLEKAKKEFSDIQFEKAQKHKNNNEFDKAFSCFMDAANNGNIRSNYYLFDLFLKKKDFNNAWIYLQKSQNLQPTDKEYDDARYFLATTYGFSDPIPLKEKKYDEAEKIFEEIINYKDSKNYLGKLQFNIYKEKGLFEYLKKSANNDYADAEFELANCYFEGRNVSKDLELAVKWFDKARFDGCQKIIPSLKEMQFELYNQFKKENPSKAFEHLKKSAENGHGEALLELGKGYADGTPLFDYEKALSYLEKAKIQGFTESDYIPKVNYELYKKFKFSDKIKAYDCLKLSCAGNYLNAKIELARCYAKDDLIPKNLDEAEKLYDELINQGHSELERERNNILREKIRNAKEPSKIIKFCEKIGLADFSDEEKKNYANNLCLNGIDLLKTKDYRSAFTNFEKASNYGNAYANYWLSEFYSKPQEFGNLKNQDIQNWKIYFDKAFNSQIWEAEYKYARYCVNGFQNIPKNKDNADNFFQRALNHYKQTPLSDTSISKKDIYREWGKLHKDSTDIGELKFARNKFEEAKKLGDSESLKLFAEVDAKIKQIEEAKRKQQMGTPQTNVVQQNQFSMQSPNLNRQPASSNLQNYGTYYSVPHASPNIKPANQNTVKSEIKKIIGGYTIGYENINGTEIFTLDGKNSTFEEIAKILPDEKLKEIINLRSGGINHIDIQG